jgi:hypothetical protein
VFFEARVKTRASSCEDVSFELQHLAFASSPAAAQLPRCDSTLTATVERCRAPADRNRLTTSEDPYVVRRSLM